MDEEQYLSRIRHLESEIEYLHGLLDNAGISYKREAKEIEDLSPDKNLAYVVNEGGEDVKVPHDSVMSELCRIAQEMDTDDENLAMALAVYLLGFSTYNGFSKVAGNVVVDVDENVLKRIYEYAKNL